MLDLWGGDNLKVAAVLWDVTLRTLVEVYWSYCLLLAPIIIYHDRDNITLNASNFCQTARHHIPEGIIIAMRVSNLSQKSFVYVVS
jgi:hypothetical protein